MRKKASISKEKRKAITSNSKKSKEIIPKEIDKEQKDPFDFGGLPIQNFKKNLGCG